MANSPQIIRGPLESLINESKFKYLKFSTKNSEGGETLNAYPYIQTRNPNYPDAPGNKDPMYENGKIINYPNKVDAERINKFLLDPSRGPMFLQKQQGLQKSNPKMETGGFNSPISFPTPLFSFLENTRYFDPSGSNLLKQVSVMGSGLYYTRHGAASPSNSFGVLGFQKNYYYTVNQQNVNNSAATNRLVTLSDLKIVSPYIIPNPSKEGNLNSKLTIRQDNFLNRFNKNLNRLSRNANFINPVNIQNMEIVNRLGISLDRNSLFQYQGGPGTFYGLGNTTILRFSDTTNLGVTRMKEASKKAMVYGELKQQNAQNEPVTQATNATTIQDFKLAKEGTRFNPIISRLDDNINRIKKRQDRKGKKNKELSQRQKDKLAALEAQKQALVGQTLPSWGTEQEPLKYTIMNRLYEKSTDGFVKYSDKLNKSLPFLFNSDEKAPWEIEGKDTDDLIKFVFEAISNDDPTYSTAIFFRAFLTAGITDNHSAELNSFRYMGRGENFYTYQGFNRTVSFSFRLAAESENDLIPMYTRLNALISQVYPDYSVGNIMRAPVIRLTIGDYFYRMPGFLESINVTVENDYPWEIDIARIMENSPNNPPKLAQLPKVLDVNISFKPILDELPRRASNKLIIGDKTIASVNLVSNQTTEVQNVSSNGAVNLIANNRDAVKFETEDFSVSSVRSATATEIQNANQEYEDAITNVQSIGF